MAVEPRPANPGFIKFDYPGSSEANPYYAPPDLAKVSPLVPDPHLLPELAADNTLGLSAVEINGGRETNEASTALLGLRSFIVEKRLRNTEKKLTQLERTDAVVRAVGTAILKREVYGGFSDKDVLRPTTSRERRAADKLKWTAYNQRHAGRRAHEESIPVRIKRNRAGEIVAGEGRRYQDGQVVMSEAEAQRARQHAEAAKKHEHHHHKLGDKFAAIIAKPGKDIVKARQKRDKLILTQASLDEAVIGKQQRKDGKRAQSELRNIQKESQVRT
jgi:hypothetical protein